MSDSKMVSRMYVHIISALAGILYAIGMWWMAGINTKAERIPILEERVQQMGKAKDDKDKEQDDRIRSMERRINNRNDR